MKFFVVFSMTTIRILEVIPISIYIFLIFMWSYIFIDSYISLKTLWADELKERIITWSSIIFNIIPWSNLFIGIAVACIGNKEWMFSDNAFDAIVVIEYSYWLISIILMLICACLFYNEIKRIHSNDFGDKIIKHIKYTLISFFSLGLIFK